MAVPVEIRRYESVRAFRADAAQMAGSGWRVWWPVAVVGAVLALLGVVSRSATFTVTYQPDMKTPDSP